MKTPKFTLILTFICLLAFLLYDAFFTGASNQILELVQDLSFVLIGAFFIFTSTKNKEADQKPNSLDAKKLAAEIAHDEKKQLEDKIKTLEAALERLIK